MKHTRQQSESNLKFISFLKRYHQTIILIAIFLLHMFFRVYQLETRANFDWDQVDNAWATRRILVEKNYPLMGMQAKLNSGLYIGPLYYYAITPFYVLTAGDPIASPIIAAITSAIGFFIIYFVVSRLFTHNTALVALLINACSLAIITNERMQWPVNFIAPLFLLLFYFLWRSLHGNSKHIIYAGVVIGLLANVHFSAIFGLVAFVFILPFLHRTRQNLLLVLASFGLMLLFIAPVIFYLFSIGPQSSVNFNSLVASYSHGFHLRRFLQIIYDAHIKFEEILFFKSLRSASFVLLPLFYLLSIIKTKRLHMAYLTFLFFTIPWVIFSMYRGEISNYYFDATRSLTVMILAVILVWFWNRKILVINLIIGLFCFTWASWNMQQFIKPDPGTLPKTRERVNQAIEQGRHIEFSHGVPDSYLYEIESKKK